MRGWVRGRLGGIIRSRVLGWCGVVWCGCGCGVDVEEGVVILIPFFVVCLDGVCYQSYERFFLLLVAWYRTTTISATYVHVHILHDVHSLWVRMNDNDDGDDE